MTPLISEYSIRKSARCRAKGESDASILILILILTTLDHFHYCCELSQFKEEQLFLTEKLRPHLRFGLLQ